MSSKAEKIFKAKMCEQTERYEDMVAIFRDIIKETAEFNNEERNVLSAAFKNLIGGKRTAFRALSAVAAKETSKEEKEGAKTGRAKLVNEFKQRIETEISKISTEVAELVDHKLLPAAKKDDEKLFYIKMKGDYYRYYCECLSGEALKPIAEKARAAYDDATKSAETSLPVTDAIRLGLALNFSVFHYEILNDPTKACKIAKDAFDNAISQLEGLPDDEYKDSASILQLLRDNLTLWQNEGDQPQNEGNS